MSGRDVGGEDAPAASAGASDPTACGRPGAGTQGGSSGHWHFLQSDLWARQKEQFGWTAIRVDSVLTLSRTLPAGVVLTYVPYAPAGRAGEGAAVPGPEPDALRRTLEVLVPCVAGEVANELGRSPAIVRFDLPQTSGTPDAPPAPSLCRAPVAVQPSDTVVIDLSRGDDELLASMHKKNRYNIRLAERKGVMVRVVDPAAPGEREASRSALRSWYGIYRETARRDRITIHAPQYYEHLFELVRPGVDPRLRLYLAEHEGDLLGGIIVVLHGCGATYLYGASSNEKRNLMPNYALQWRAMRDARESGCGWYDLFGVPPADDPKHPLHGLYRFKTGFGGELVRRLGAWDAIVQPLRGRAYRVAERLRDVYVHRVRRHAVR
ncbi:MAG: lipid II:glycine glycyltransferase FemX [Spirochaetota bacterium]